MLTDNHVLQAVHPVAVLLLIGMLATHVAYAQTSADVSDDIDSQTAVDLAKLDQDAAVRNDKWRFTVGAGVASVPRYEGASSKVVRAFPLLDARYGHFYIGTGRGIGYNFSDDMNIQYGLRLHRVHGRKQDADPRLYGTGDISRAAEAGVYVNAHFSSWYLTSSLSSSSNGAHLDLGGGYVMQLAATDYLRFGPSLDWASSKYMQTYFGIDTAQSAASSLPIYTAGSGIKGYAINASWSHIFSRAWFGNLGLSFKQLTGDARLSPLVQSQTLYTSSLMFGYRF